MALLLRSIPGPRHETCFPLTPVPPHCAPSSLQGTPVSVEHVFIFQKQWKEDPKGQRIPEDSTLMEESVFPSPTPPHLENLLPPDSCSQLVSK